MKHTCTILFLLSIVSFGSCVSMKEKKSAKYYFQHEEKINGILENYTELYKQQAFNLGFSDRDYSHIGMDIITDTIRYAIDNQLRSTVIKEAVTAFGYDTLKMRKLYMDMYDIRCIWLGRDDIYRQGQKSMVTYLSFRSVAFGNPFLDRKYYTLVFFDPADLNDDLKADLAKQGFKNVKGAIYFGIMGKFR